MLGKIILSVVCGLGLSLLPTIIFYKLLFAENSEPKSVVKSFYFGEAAKFGCLVFFALFSLAALPIDPNIFFISFSATQFVCWLVYLISLKRVLKIGIR